jgi:hypothetical protein
MTSTKNPFLFLLGGLLVALLVAPIAMERYPGFTGFLLTLTLLIAAFSMSPAKRFSIAAWSLVAAKMILTLVSYFHESAAVHVAESVIMFAFFVLATMFSFKRVLEGEYVDLNRIAGAISVYMLMGLIWASMYFFISLLDPGAFEGLADMSSFQVTVMNAAFMDLLYYSYVTLSTLGYGDITPVSRAAQSLAYLEAICGVMYVAVLVAALVGSYGNKRVAQA